MVLAIGQYIRQYREERNLKQKQLAMRLGIERSTLAAYECDNRNPSYSVLIRIAEVLNTSTDQLLGRMTSDYLDISGLSAEDSEMIRRLVERLRTDNE